MGQGSLAQGGETERPGWWEHSYGRSSVGGVKEVAAAVAVVIQC